ncbi:O-antigen translocase [Aquimarina rhabdastrellae]
MSWISDKFRKNVLLKVTSWNAVGVIVQLIAGITSSKIIALFLGAEGMALIGNIRNFLTSIQSISTLGIYNAVVRYIAEYRDNKAEISKILSTTYYLGVTATMLMAVGLYYGADFWNTYIFGITYHFAYVFKAMAIALPLYALNMLCLAIINGYSKYKTYIIINIVGSILGLIITVFLIWQFKLEGAFIAIVVNPAIAFLITFVIILNQRNFSKLIKVEQVSKTYMKRFGVYAIMALISAIALPAIMIKIRNYISLTQGIDSAGHWEAMQRISGQYLLFINTLLGVYLLPKLSGIKRSRFFKEEVLNFYKTILPLFGLGLVVVYLLRTYIIKWFLSTSFAAVEPLFMWQLIGDFFKVASLVIAYQFIAKKMFWHYVIIEIISLSFLYFMSIYFIDEYGYIGATIAHALDYMLLLIILIIVFRKSFFGPDRAI